MLHHQRRQTGEARTDIAKCNGRWQEGAAIRIRFGFITYARRRQWATDGRVATGQSTATATCPSATLNPLPPPAVAPAESELRLGLALNE